MEKRLGRGLGSLLGQPAVVEAETRPFELRVDEIRPNRYQPRSVFDPEALAELTSSIRQHGVLQPIAVRPTATGYELISGERRWRAAQAAGLRVIPVVVRKDVGDAQMLELALVENVQRQDLDAIERARGYQQMIEQLGITQDEVARKVGLKRATVTNHLRLLDLPAEIQEAVSRGLLSMGHARAMIGITGAGAPQALLERIVRDDLSVRQVEELVRQAVRPASPAASATVPSVPPAWIKSIEERLRNALGTKIALRNGSGYRGQVVIEYFGREDLDRLVDVLAPEAKL